MSNAPGSGAALTAASLERAVRAAGILAPVRFEEVTDSTNARALALAEDGAPEWTIVAAGHQTAGRGRLGRTWLDDAGRSLLFSLVLRPELSPTLAGLLSLLAGAAVADACRDVAAVEAGCKWPNDVLVRDRKLAGILAEASVAEGRLRHLVLGVGVNLAPPPVGLTGATGLEGADAAGLLGSFLSGFREAYRPREPGFAADVVRRHRERSVTIGRRVRAQTVSGEVVEGDAVGIDDRGGLLVATDGGVAVVGFGEVLHLDA
ncbi:MAG: biotin--[acetyl-CoA-carboxylase] ligase [Actinomycetota bacterium]|nr:biotin--[acetyl-CoA-carboxylase] ligase [Actinomycetota bacterium]